MPSEDRETIKHPSFGMVSVHRISGHAKLFGVDYPQDHSIRITIQRGEVHRDLSHHWFFGNENQVIIEMSEVQYARMIATPNTSGVPCTLKYAWEDGKFAKMPDPPDHMADMKKITDEIKDRGNKATEGLRRAEKILQAMRDGTMKMTMANLDAAREALGGAITQTVSNIAYVVECGIETVTEAGENAKAEAEAHIAFQLEELGKAALRERVSDNVSKGGVFMRIGGKKVELTAPKPQTLIENED